MRRLFTRFGLGRVFAQDGMREGYVNVEWKAELARLDHQQAELEAAIAAAAQPPAPAFHPNMARVFDQKIRSLAAALEHEDPEQRETARSCCAT